MVDGKAASPVFSWRPTTEQDCVDMLRDIREFSKEDLLIAAGDGEEGLRSAIAGSREVYTGLVDGRVGLIYGVRLINILSGHAYLWMMSTKLADQYWVTFTRAAIIYTYDLLKQYDQVTSICPMKNKKSEKWLKFLGFTPGPIVRMHRIKFKTFSITRDTIKPEKLNWFEGDDKWQPLPRSSASLAES